MHFVVISGFCESDCHACVHLRALPGTPRRCYKALGGQGCKLLYGMVGFTITLTRIAYKVRTLRVPLFRRLDMQQRDAVWFSYPALDTRRWLSYTLSWSCCTPGSDVRGTYPSFLDYLVLF